MAGLGRSSHRYTLTHKEKTQNTPATRRTGLSAVQGEGMRAGGCLCNGNRSLEMGDSYVDLLHTAGIQDNIRTIKTPAISPRLNAHSQEPKASPSSSSLRPPFWSPRLPQAARRRSILKPTRSMISVRANIQLSSRHLTFHNGDRSATWPFACPSKCAIMEDSVLQIR